MIKSTCVAAIVLALLVGADWAEAIIRRHDRDDARYLELGARYPQVTRLGGGTATLIDPRWLLTAGHVAANLSPFDRSVRFGERTYEVKAVVIHPAFRQRPRTAAVDVALVQLADPVTGITPAHVHAARDEKGMEVVFVGPGMHGDGKRGPVADDEKMRAATNVVTDALDNYISFKFDAPPDGTELEGISGPGDSGGPALIESEGQTRVVGVSSANDSAGADGPCRYGSTEYYARVSSVADWIGQTMATDPPARQSPVAIVDVRNENWPDSPAGRVAEAFFRAYARGDDASMEAFELTWRAEAALQDRPVPERVESWRRLRGDWGALVARKYVQASPTELHVLVRAEGERVFKSLRFELSPAAPHKLMGIAIASPVAGD